jgi:hypothetical protein
MTPPSVGSTVKSELTVISDGGTSLIGAGVMVPLDVPPLVWRTHFTM